MDPLSYLLRLALLGTGYFAGARLGVALATLNSDVTLLWPASGIALAGLYLGGYRLVPGIFLGKLLFIFSSSSLPTAVAVLDGLNASFEAILGVWLLRASGFRPELKRARDVASLLVLAGVLPSLLCSLFGALLLSQYHLIPNDTFPQVAFGWWIGDAMGIVVFAPLVILWGRKPFRRPRRLLEGGLAAGSIVLIGWFLHAFRAELGVGNQLPKCLLFPSLIWAAVRLGPRGTATSIAFMALLIASGMVTHVTVDHPLSEHEQLIHHISVLAVVSFCGLVLASVYAEREESFTQIRTSESKLQAILQAGSDGLWECDIQTNQVRWSEQIYQLLNYSHADFDGTFEAVQEMIHPDDRLKFTQAIDDHLAHHAPFDIELRIRCGDGSYGHFRSVGQLVRLDGAIQGMVGSIHDISDRIQAENERLLIERRLMEAQRLESLGVLAGGIAHDFNNLLTTMLGNANLVQMDLPGSSPLHPNLEAIERAALRAADLCQQMLAYAGKSRFQTQALDLSEVLSESGRLIQVSVGKLVELHYHLAADLPLVQGDSVQLRQIVVNLVINASEAIGDARGAITIRTGTASWSRLELDRLLLGSEMAEGLLTWLEVEDTGTGMDSRTMAKIFDPFFTTKFVGRGLGLAAVLGLVRQHRGALQVESTPGIGTRIRVLFPSATVMDTVASRQLVPGKSEWRGEGTVLLAEDEEQVRLLTRRILEAFGFKVVPVGSGRQAVETFRSEPKRFRVVLLDLSLPEIRGIQVLDEIRTIQPNVLAIVIAGQHDPEFRRRMADIPTVVFLQKPFNANELRAIMQRLVPNPVGP